MDYLIKDQAGEVVDSRLIRVQVLKVKHRPNRTIGTFVSPQGFHRDSSTYTDAVSVNDASQNGSSFLILKNGMDDGVCFLLQSRLQDFKRG